MLLFGHTGMALGAAVFLAGALTGGRAAKAQQNGDGESAAPASPVAPTAGKPPDDQTSWLDALATRLDIRLLLIGSLLPDIIDKPVGQFFFRETFNNGRIFAHTLLFLILVTVAGFYSYRRQSQTWRLSLSLGTLTHLIFDQMWRVPPTLLWPLYGFSFVKVDISNWGSNMLQALLTNPAVYITELVGVAILVWFVGTLQHRRKIYAFIRYGRIQ